MVDEFFMEVADGGNCQRLLHNGPRSRLQLSLFRMPTWLQTTFKWPLIGASQATLTTNV